MRTEIVFSNKLDSVTPSTYCSVIKEKFLQPTRTTILDKPLPSNVDVNNVSKFIAYYVGDHELFLASEDFHHLSTLYKHLKKMDPRIRC